MRLNKNHKETLIDFACDRIEPPKALAAKVAKTQANAETKIGEFFARKLGPDLPTLKRHNVVQKLTHIVFVATESQRAKYEPTKNTHRLQAAITLSNDSEVWDVVSPGFGRPYYTVPNPVFAAVYAAHQAGLEMQKFETAVKKDFRVLLARATTFKRACALWPEFENAAHLVMSNTGLTTTDEELIAKLAKYKVADNGR